jgi:hypothetical protein
MMAITMGAVFADGRFSAVAAARVMRLAVDRRSVGGAVVLVRSWATALPSDQEAESLQGCQRRAR